MHMTFLRIAWSEQFHIYKVYKHIPASSNIDLLMKFWAPTMIEFYENFPFLLDNSSIDPSNMWALIQKKDHAVNHRSSLITLLK